MSNREFKPGDRVLVEAAVEQVGFKGAEDTVVRVSTPGCHRMSRLHPLPAFVLEEVDVECGEPEYPSIKPSEMRVGDVVKPSDGDWGRQVLTVVKEDAVAWVIAGERKASMWCDSEMLSYSWHWQLTRRDGVDMATRKRMRYCDLPEGRYVEQDKDGDWFGVYAEDVEVSEGSRIFRIVEVK